MDHLDLAPIRSVRGTVKLPGSKSISNRILLLAALARGETRIHDLLQSDDTTRMLEALRALGIPWQREGENRYSVRGAAGAPTVKSAQLFLGNAGTAFRPLTAVLALAGGHYTLSGVPRMHERPIGDLVDALKQLGAHVRYSGRAGYPPLELHPATLKPIAALHVRGDVSSQFVTALLIALPLLQRHVRLNVVGELTSKPYVEITLNTDR